MTPRGRRSYILDVFQDFSKPSWLRFFCKGFFFKDEKGPQEKRQLVKPLEAPHIGEKNWIFSNKKRDFHGSSPKKKTQQQHPEKTWIF